MKPRGFERRYVFMGTLVLKTGLHVGSAWATGSSSDNPIIRTPDGRPFIPGSSFKGAFRSTVEKLTLTVGLKSCALMEGQGCVGAQGKEQKMFNERRNDARQNNEEWNDSQLLAELDQDLCDTCKLFGSSYMASRITFADLLPPEADDLANQMIQIRDGVAIDRDSEKAVDRLKFDYEVVAPAQTFEMQIVLDNPSDFDLALTCLGLSEFVSGLGYIGGKRSRGLANCQIEGLKVYELDLRVENKRAKRLKKYLLGQSIEEKMTRLKEPADFINQQIELLL